VIEFEYLRLLCVTTTTGSFQSIRAVFPGTPPLLAGEGDRRQAVEGFWQGRDDIWRPLIVPGKTTPPPDGGPPLLWKRRGVMMQEWELSITKLPVVVGALATVGCQFLIRHLDWNSPSFPVFVFKDLLS